MAADYSGATWYGNGGNNYTGSDREASYNINQLVIHVTQGSWSSAINWFASPDNTGSSAHYVVRSSDGFIGQSVHEKDIAWHAGWWDTNCHSVGIEHEGYIDDPSWFTDAMYHSSAKLSAYLCKKYNIPIDRTHVIGHYQVPGCSSGYGGGVDCHTDPGQYWDWSKYMNLIAYYAGVYTQVADNATADRFSASSNWGTSSYSSQRYGADYRFTKPASVNDFARFKVKIPQTADYAIYGWWAANSGYNDSTRIRISTTSGAKWVKVNQRQSGGEWVYLGTFNMAAADSYSVAFSRRTAGSGYVIADAVKVVKK